MVGTDKPFPKRTGYPRDPSETDLGGGRSHSYTDAAILSNRKNGDAVSRLVRPFHQEGLKAIEPKHGAERSCSTEWQSESGSCENFDGRQNRPRWNSNVVVEDIACGLAKSTRRLTQAERRYDPDGSIGSDTVGNSRVVGVRLAQRCARENAEGYRDRSRHRAKKKLIGQAYQQDKELKLPV